MTDTLSGRLQGLLDGGHQALLRGGLMGLEKESLRVSPEGGIARTPHPVALGSPLTHPWITTDYSEALLEFITPPFGEPGEALAFLRDLQTFTYPRIGEEFLWATSMPCVLAGEAAIPVARYGSSNPARMKTVYRLGLGHRYGRVMQVIAGVHFNYSVPDGFWPVYQRLCGDGGDLREFIDAGYFAMIRNLQRLGWMVPYLFGASPAVCKSFLGGKPTHMPEFNENTYYEPFATSLRMGDIGYQNRKEEETGIKACYDSLEAYTDSLACAIDTPSPVYEKIGVVVDGEYRQLNANILQIENEYYSSVRPKPVMEGNEKPVVALRRRGVRYVELRSLDVNAFEPLGVCETQLRFLEAFMFACLLMDSPVIGEVERLQIDHNQSAAAHRGRDPDLKLLRNGDQVPLRTWAEEVVNAMEPLCAAMDGTDATRPYSTALERQRDKVLDPSLTPSARMLAEMAERREGFYEFARRLSRGHQQYFRDLVLAPGRETLFEAEARASMERQREIEAADDCSFEEYLRRYFAQSA
ncbi:glutamate--cysteine ligase [Thioalkalivibrio denitrificans]|uniref:Glutamate--cysteine ligase n=1 Tax=Thioalkalivibrio denitrificans TaxID=108003 RepID=A0A1V3NAM4_9GAMM|nr:glutamate--cysteine ligase [Thioalkalivibrio denitrificans]OOG22013.1 glutamate--cysteine ligase [Thioalkalivibrio denitrificans]